MGQKKDLKKAKKQEKLEKLLNQAESRGYIEGILDAIALFMAMEEAEESNDDCDDDCCGCCDACDEYEWVTEELEIEEVVFSNRKTIVKWDDGTKTVVKCSENDSYSPYAGLVNAICKKCFANNKYGFVRQMEDILKKAKYYGSAKKYDPSLKDNAKDANNVSAEVKDSEENEIINNN